MSQKNKQNSRQSIIEEGFPEKRQKTTNSQTSKTPKTSNLDTRQNRPRKKITPNPKLNTQNNKEEDDQDMKLLQSKLLLTYLSGGNEDLEKNSKVLSLEKLNETKNLNSQLSKENEHKKRNKNKNKKQGQNKNKSKNKYQKNNNKTVVKETETETEIEIEKESIGNDNFSLYETLQKACLVTSFTKFNKEEDKFQFFESKNKHLFFKKYYQGSNFVFNIAHVFSENPKRLFVSISIKSYDYFSFYLSSNWPYSEDPDCEPSLFYLSKTIPLNEYISYLSTDPEKRIPIVFCGHGLGGSIAQIITFNLLKELESKKKKIVLGKDLVGIGFGSPLWLNSKYKKKYKRYQKLFINILTSNDLLPLIFSHYSSICQDFLSNNDNFYQKRSLKRFDYLIQKYFRSNKYELGLNEIEELKDIYEIFLIKEPNPSFEYSPIGQYLISLKNKKFRFILKEGPINRIFNNMWANHKDKFSKILDSHKINSYQELFKLDDNYSHIYNINKNKNKNKNNKDQKKKLLPIQQIYKKYPITIRNLKVLTCNDWIQITLIGKNLDHSTMRIRNQKFKLGDLYYPLILYNAPISEYSELTTIHISSNKLIFSMSNFKNFNFQNFSFKIKTLFNSSQEINILKENIIHRKISTKILKKYQNIDSNLFKALITQSFYQIKSNIAKIYDNQKSVNNNNNGRFKLQKKDKKKLLNSSILLNYLEELMNLYNFQPTFKEILNETIFKNFNYGTDIAIKKAIAYVQPLLKTISQPIILSKKNNLNGPMNPLTCTISVLSMVGALTGIWQIGIPLSIITLIGYKLLNFNKELGNFNYLEILRFILTELKSNLSEIDLINSSIMENEIVRLIGEKKLKKIFRINNTNNNNKIDNNNFDCYQEEIANSSYSDDVSDSETNSYSDNDSDDDDGDKIDIEININENETNSISNEECSEINNNEKEKELQIEKENEKEKKKEKKMDSDSGYSYEKDNNKIIINNSNKEDEARIDDQNDINTNYEDEDEDEDDKDHKIKNQIINEKLTKILEKKFQNYKNFDSTSQLILNKRIRLIYMINEMRKILSKRLIIGVVGVSNSGKTTFINKAFNKKINCGIRLYGRTRHVGLYNLGDSNNYFVMDFPGSDDVENNIKKLNKYFNCNPCLYIYICTAEHIQRSERKALKQISKYNVPTIICLNKVDHYPELLNEEPSKYKYFLQTNSNNIYWTCFKLNKDHNNNKLKIFENEAKKCKNYRSIGDIKKWICKELYLQVKSNKFLLNELKRVVENELKIDFEKIQKKIENDLINNYTNNISNDNNDNNNNNNDLVTDPNNIKNDYMTIMNNFEDNTQKKKYNKKKQKIDLLPEKNLMLTKKNKQYFKFQAVVISDLHLGAGIIAEGKFPKYKNKMLLTHFLNSIKKEKSVTHLILLGDIWDNWATSIDLQPPDILEVINHYNWFKEALYSVSSSGKKIIYIKGNHDLDLTKEDLAIAFPDLPIEFYPEKFYYGERNEILFQHGNSYDLFNQEICNIRKLPKEFNYPFGYYITRIATSSDQLTNHTATFIEKFIKIIPSRRINQSLKLLQTFNKLGMEKLIEKMLIQASGNEQNWNKFKEKNIILPIFKDNKYLEIPIKAKGFWFFKQKEILDSYLNYFENWEKEKGSNNVPNYIKGAIGDFDHFLNKESKNGTKIVVLGHTHKNLLKRKSFDSRNIIYANTGGWSNDLIYKSWVIVSIDHKEQINVDLKEISIENNNMISENHFSYIPSNFSKKIY
ncbi:udp-2 [Anaeramoeba flamelloides]|uniref:Udp-2 n=1 Tax=Anaeramoeba flamelloides TaxID=1746091 RepID=A0ABQ8Z6W3_9EUKA|nr:udp-2 [Anaeramoeba flamelloides]